MIITRRLFLRSTAAAGAAGMTATVPAMATEAAPNPDSYVADENPALLEAWKQCRAAEKDHREAKEALEWLPDEWKHRWPLAPEEILWHANARAYGDNAEVDIIGRQIFRNTADLTRTRTKEFLQRHPRTCFALYGAEDTAVHLAEVRNRKVGGKSEKTREKNRRVLQRYTVELETRLRLAREYEAETARLRTIAGVDTAKERITAAAAEVERLARVVMTERPWTLYGLRLQADLLLYTLERYRITKEHGGVLGETMHLVCNLMDATEHLSPRNAAGVAS